MEMEAERSEPEKKPKKPLGEMFDLNGDKKICSYVARFEEIFRQREALQADLKQIAADAAEDMLTKREIDAIKKVAKWRVDDKLGAAQELFTAMHRVENALRIDLFTWVDSKAT